MSQRISVTCYAGYKGGERPTSFKVGEADLAVREIIDRWYDWDGNYFKVLAEDDVQYLLRHNMEEDIWELVEQSANKVTDRKAVTRRTQRRHGGHGEKPSGLTIPGVLRDFSAASA